MVEGNGESSPRKRNTTSPAAIAGSPFSGSFVVAWVGEEEGGWQPPCDESVSPFPTNLIEPSSTPAFPFSGGMRRRVEKCTERIPGETGRKLRPRTSTEASQYYHCFPPPRCRHTYTCPFSLENRYRDSLPAARLLQGFRTARNGDWENRSRKSSIEVSWKKCQFVLPRRLRRAWAALLIISWALDTRYKRWSDHDEVTLLKIFTKCSPLILMEL